MKRPSALTSIIFLALCITGIVGCFLWIYPEETAATVRIGPFSHPGVIIFCLALVIVILVAGWFAQMLTVTAGKKGGNQNEDAGNNVGNSSQPEAPLHTDEYITCFTSGPIIDHLRLRYGYRWKSKVRLLLVQGTDDHIENVVPGLKRDHWQENDGIVLIHAGSAKTTPDPEFVDVLNEVRPQRPVDGIVQVMDCKQFPDAAALDTMVRSRQKSDSLFGWQAPVWLWFIREEAWRQEGEGVPATGTLFGPGASPDAAVESLSTLSSRLRRAGMPMLLSDTRHGWLLQLSNQLCGRLKQQLIPLLTSLMTGPVPYRLRGLMFSPVLPATSTLPHARLSHPAWQAVEDDCLHVHARKIGFHWRRVLRLMMLALVLLWGAGVLLSLMVNRAQIYQAQQTARAAADTTQPLTERLRNQLVLQQAVARLQDRETHGAPWYTRFGLNQDRETLNALWPLYARNNQILMRDALVDELHRQLSVFVELPPASAARTAGFQKAYNLLKGYLMLARPDKAEAIWFAGNMLKVWPSRSGVADSAWQTLAPKLLGFYAQNLPAHLEWKIKPDTDLVGSVRQILLKQIGQRNAESGLYQEMLLRIARNWPDLTLADMTGDTDASTIFSTEEVVPGMFTRQAWEEQVENAIDEVVKTRRDEIDWVLTDNSHQADSDISPQALRLRLIGRYFTDFGNAWLNMVNSIQWHEAESLPEAIAQLSLLADVRQSPLVALMNTLAWQGQTGVKGEALADSLMDSAKKLVGSNKNAQQFIVQAKGPEGPLDSVFGPLNSLMAGKDGTGSNGNLSFQSWLARVTQARLKLQQVTSAPDPQAMAQMMAQTVFQGKAIDLTETRDYGSLVAASLGLEWNGFAQALFVQPLDLAWRQVLAPATGSLNARWQRTIVSQWNTAFAGRYPFKATGSDASLALLAQFLRGDSGRIAAFLKTNLGGILHQEGSHWMVDPSASQGMTVNPAFLAAINQLADISDIIFAQGDAGVHFELMARPSRGVARMQLTLDGQNLDYFNQMESWQSFTWPGNTYYPGVDLSWRSNTAEMRLYEHHQGNWGLIRLLDKALIAPLDSSRTQLMWITPDGNSLKFIMRSELGDGPLALLKLQGFRLPESIFSVSTDAMNNTFTSTAGK